MKVYAREKIKAKKDLAAQIMTERNILEKVSGCPFLACLKYAFQSKDNLFLVLEFAQGGDLFSMVQDGPLAIPQLKIYLAEIVIAIEELHKHKIIYRDLKLENVLLGNDGHVIVSDFGLSFEASAVDEEGMSRLCGTPEYLAPESGDETLLYSFGIDWWAFGTLAHELATGSNPSTITSFSKDRKAFQEQLRTNTMKIKDKIDRHLRDLLEKLFVTDPTKRLGYERGSDEIKQHIFFNSINWERVKAKQLKPPIITILDNKYDTSNFDSIYTSAPCDFTDNSSMNYDSKDFANFNFIATELTVESNQPAKKLKREP